MAPLISNKDFYKKIDYLMGVKKYDMVISQVSRLLAEDIDNSNLYFCLAYAYYFGKHNLMEAEKAILNAIRLDPSIGKYHNLYGLILRYESDDKADSEFLNAIELDPGKYYYYSNYARCLLFFNLPKPDRVRGEIERYARHALSLNPGDAEAYSVLGSLYYYLWELELSEVEFKEALKLNPENAAFQTQYGLLLKRMGKKYRREEMYRESARLEPNNKIFQNNLLSLIKCKYKIYYIAGLRDIMMESMPGKRSIISNILLLDILLIIPYMFWRFLPRSPIATAVLIFFAVIALYLMLIDRIMNPFIKREWIK